MSTTATPTETPAVQPPPSHSYAPSLMGSLMGGTSGWRLRYWANTVVPKVEDAELELREITDQQLRKASLALRYRAKAGEALSTILPEAFALARVAGKRTLGMRHFDVQIIGGAAMFHGTVAEMQTGEGKTLTATLPVYLHALQGKGSHLATVNDYLALRDAEWMTPLYEMLGMTIGCIQTDMSQDERRKHYACDITYGTAKEFGFDFLRDRLLMRRMRQQASDIFGQGGSQAWNQSGEQPVQRGHHFCLVDEADSVLIDEARTPLIISALPDETAKIEAACYDWAAHYSPQFVEDEHYEYDHEKKQVDLLPYGRQMVRTLPHEGDVGMVGLVDLYEFMERAIKVNKDFERDREYVVRDGEIVIVDESTGRLAEGRKWRDGIHQALEAREEVEVTVATGQAARITIQDLFLRYKFLGGMTGTATTSAREIRKIYKAPVIAIPTNRPCIRQRLSDKVYGTAEAKWNAIVEEVEEMHRQGRPVLVGTRSIDRSEYLARLLQAKGIEHEVLNAHREAEEAEIVKEAGKQGKVMVATNMAGRGTDIKLGEGVAQAGGLHVICTELHDSARIDRQLIGRCSRQGDPGSFRQFMSLDDDIVKTGLGPDKADQYKRQGERGLVTAVSSRSMRAAQHKVERKHFRDRQILLYFEKQRKKLQREMGQDPYLDSPD